MEQLKLFLEEKIQDEKEMKEFVMDDIIGSSRYEFEAISDHQNHVEFTDKNIIITYDIEYTKTRIKY